MHGGTSFGTTLQPYKRPKRKQGRTYLHVCLEHSRRIQRRIPGSKQLLLDLLSDEAFHLLVQKVLTFASYSVIIYVILSNGVEKREKPWFFLISVLLQKRILKTERYTFIILFM